MQVGKGFISSIFESLAYEIPFNFDVSFVLITKLAMELLHAVFFHFDNF